jgi:DNA-binding transcriptional LysR family regulator
MELADLAVFRAVVRTGGVTRAAATLHRVPSNVTVRVRKLEDELGVALFLREGRRMVLTPGGERLLAYADRLLALAEEARDAVATREPRGLLRLGAMESTAAARLPRVLMAFQARWPSVDVELHTGDPRRLVADVLAGTLDAALVAEPVDDPRLATRMAFREELVLVAGPGHARIRAPADLRPQVLLAFHPGCPHRTRFEQWFASGGRAPQRVVEVASYHAILGCAVAGMGTALMPRSVLETFTDRARLTTHPMPAPMRTAHTLLAWRAGVAHANVDAFAHVLPPVQAARRRVGS